ncbi:ribonuclease III [Alkalilimnicola ehrlichii MLHE-1]|uniref:Ribonuclease 3 n=1 Tax=Alkalilimnicola ehrlichii (strain ATCC BAA-1101 / DSM 17681 / MLHE-1) TaxID=187272 RepID=RNC_ALKEH|nr:ribonuclease III [Alkalilimnicola ehrlichii]Q0A8Z1.1 RecName: Full=Ribonuclease 3; AltName: Full=Ribonuclease III; Short=RNase III [Alkalilimnicola ehrlichii MLHE-1]ABI56696.1 RNAse III [Alkalilimnicola ehrlichii MLHE-1]
MPTPKDALQDRLGYRFRRPELLDEALTHRSVTGPDNERLEFLGDGILNFVIADELYHRRPDATEGVLSRLRATLVNGRTLAEIGKGLDVGTALRLGGGEMKSGGQRRKSILADAVEALFGAIYLDGGFDPSRETILRLYRDRLASLPTEAELKDPKTRLQEHLQAGRRPLPRYEVLEVSGQSHDQTFRVACRLQDAAVTAEGEAGSRRKAEQQAAEQMLKRLEDKHER